MTTAYLPPRYSPLWEMRHWIYLRLQAIGNTNSLPIPQLQKSKRLIELQKESKCDVFVETGTYVGDTLFALRNHFSELHSIELSSDFFEFSIQRLRKYSNIHLHLGDSAVVLSRLIANLPQSAFFWLDGHYSGPGTAGTFHSVPLMAELSTILSRQAHKDVIVIDDIRLLNGTHGYPTLAELITHVRQRRPQMAIQENQDMIILR